MSALQMATLPFAAACKRQRRVMKRPTLSSPCAALCGRDYRRRSASARCEARRRASRAPSAAFERRRATKVCRLTGSFSAATAHLQSTILLFALLAAASRLHEARSVVVVDHVLQPAAEARVPVGRSPRVAYLLVVLQQNGERLGVGALCCVMCGGGAGCVARVDVGIVLEQQAGCRGAESRERARVRSERARERMCVCVASDRRRSPRAKRAVVVERRPLVVVKELKRAHCSRQRACKRSHKPSACIRAL